MTARRVTAAVPPGSAVAPQSVNRADAAAPPPAGPADAVAPQSVNRADAAAPPPAGPADAVAPKSVNRADATAPAHSGPVAQPSPILRFGGQAVIEGVMMRGPDAVAVAVRRPDGRIVVRTEPRPAPTRHPWLRLPVVRGVAVLGESVVVGIQALLYSAEQAAPEDETVSRAQLNLTLAGALIFAIGLFFVLPTWLASLARAHLHGALALNLIEGGVRVAILLGYLSAITLMRDIQRVLQYHGAEHKAIHALERGHALTVDAARAQSRLHPRCGTSFLLLVVLVSVAVFALFGWPVLWERIGLRLVLLPVLAGLGYEALRASAHLQGVFAPVVAPGLWLQRLTTREPEDDQLEVALAALTAAGACPPGSA